MALLEVIAAPAGLIVLSFDELDWDDTRRVALEVDEVCVHFDFNRGQLEAIEFPDILDIDAMIMPRDRSRFILDVGEDYDAESDTFLLDFWGDPPERLANLHADDVDGAEDVSVAFTATGRICRIVVRNARTRVPAWIPR